MKYDNYKASDLRDKYNNFFNKKLTNIGLGQKKKKYYYYLKKIDICQLQNGKLFMQNFINKHTN